MTEYKVLKGLQKALKAVIAFGVPFSFSAITGIEFPVIVSLLIGGVIIFVLNFLKIKGSK